MQPDQIDPAAVAEFLAAIYGTVPDDRWLCFWEGQDRQSLWLQRARLDHAVLPLARWADRDVYVGCCVASSAGPVNRRIAADQATGLSAYYAEIDWVDEAAHKKGALCPDRDAAWAFLRDAVLRPTHVVESGHGLHGWWVLDAFWDLSDPAEHARAAQAMLAFQHRIRQAAAAEGWTTDAVHDLSRILRVPGTWNWKDAAHPVLARWHPDVGPTYSNAHLLEYAGEFNAQEMGSKPEGNWNEIVTPAADITFNPQATIDPQIVDALCETDPLFRDTWNRRRVDLDTRDSSQSAYDLALLNQLKDHCTDQQLCDWLVAYRRHHREDLKRLDYYLRTIYAARTTREEREQARGLRPIKGGADLLLPSPAEPILPIETLQRWLGIDLQGVECSGEEPRDWRFYGAGWRSEVLTTKQMRNKDCCMAALQDACHQNPTDVPPKRWKTEVVGMIERAAIIRPGGLETTDAATMREWLVGHLRHVRPLDAHTWEAHGPFLYEGHVYVRRHGLLTYLRTTQHMQWPDRKALNALVDAGWEYLPKGTHAIILPEGATVSDTTWRREQDDRASTNGHAVVERAVAAGD